MRFFTLNNRKSASSEPKGTAEIPLVSVEAQVVVNYSDMQKAALAHERRAVDNKSITNRTQFSNKIVDRGK
jgi:hypothetical protein